MASLQKKGEGWYCHFTFAGRRHAAALGKVSEADAEGFKARYEQILRLLSQGLLSLPAGVDVCEFLRHDGKPPPPPLAARPEPMLAQLRDDYLQTHRSSLEPNTVATIETHFRHLAG